MCFSKGESLSTEHGRALLQNPEALYYVIIVQMGCQRLPRASLSALTLSTVGHAGSCAQVAERLEGNLTRCRVFFWAILKTSSFLGHLV